MSLAEEAREAIRDRPALFDALRAGVLNYSAAARRLDVDGEEEAVATAIRRFEADLETSETEPREARVRMNRLERSRPAPIAVGGEEFSPGEGSWTAITATGAVDALALEGVLGMLRTHGVEVEAAGVAEGSLVVVVGRRDGADALRLVERGLETSPARRDD